MKYTMIVVVLVLSIIIFAGGCSMTSEKSDDLAGQLHQKHNRSSSSKIADEIVEEIIDSAKNKDYSRINKLFSEYARDNEKLEAEFNEFCDYCDFETSNVQGLVDYSEKSRYGGHYLEYYLGYEFMLKSDNSKYLLHVVWVADNEKDQSTIGIQSIEILKYEYASPSKYWRNSSKSGFHIIYE